MKLESTTTNVEKSSEEVFNFLSKVENFEKIMPENTEKFEVDGESFLFGLKGMPEIRLVMKEKTPHSSIVLGAASSKFPFTLTADIQEVTAGSSKVQLLFNGEFNPMVAMMVKSPLQKFITTLSDNMAKV